MRERFDGRAIGTVETSDILTDWNALGFMIAGIGLIVLLAALVFVLATGRVRALARLGSPVRAPCSAWWRSSSVF